VPVCAVCAYKNVLPIRPSAEHYQHAAHPNIAENIYSSNLTIIGLQGAMALRQLLAVVAVLGLVSVATGGPLQTCLLLTRFFC
jgi:hypothetical protein